jgi:MFS family permease
MKTTEFASSQEHTHKHHPLINQNFAFLWCGQAISILGDFMFNTTLVVWIAVVLAKGYSWTPLAVSGIFLAASLPSILLGPLAGVFIDRWNKCSTMLFVNILQATLVVFLLLQVSIPVTARLPLAQQLSIIYLIVFLLNICEQFFRPAQITLIDMLVEEQEQARAVGLGQVSVSIAMLVGPAVAPPLLLTFGVHWALLFNLLSFVASFFLLRCIHVQEFENSVSTKKTRRFLVEFWTGVLFLFKTRVLRILVILSFLTMLSAGILYALDIFFVTQNLHTPPSLYGVLDTSVGVGAILGAVLASVFAQRLGLARTLWLSIMMLGLLIFIYARLTSFLPAVGLLFLVGIPLSAIEIAVGPLLLQATPKHLVGRISALLNPVTTVATLLGSAVAGYLAVQLQHFHLVLFALSFGTIDTIFTIAGLLLLISGIYAMVSLQHDDTRKKQVVQEPSEERDYSSQEGEV